MKKNTVFSLLTVASLLLPVVISSCSSGSTKLPIIKATSVKVDIRDGQVFKKSDWRISPKTKPDIYKTYDYDSRVTFYTDIDSISFLVEKDKTYDFIILLNGKDSAFTRIQCMPSYLDVLKAAKDYDSHDDRVKAEFTYRSEVNPDLKSIRTKFKLDSIAGAGDEISRYLNVLHWVHNTFRHDGTKDAPVSTGVEDLMTKCFRNQQTMDCGSLATVLSNCYLALGDKAKRIVCMPKDSTDIDCHSIDMVYSKTLKKWLWMDPTNDAYVMDENNQLLGISEVRERLINGKPLRLNPDANWNHERSVTAENYLFSYMTKNLYALAFFNESNGAYKLVVLLPSEFKGILPRTKSPDLLNTHNPEVFWSSPE